MHILVLPSFYPSPPRPTAGIFFQDQVRALSRRGHQLGVLVAPRMPEVRYDAHQSGTFFRLFTYEEQDAVPIYRMNWGFFPRIFPLLCAQVHAYFGLKTFDHYVEMHGKPDLIHTHNIFYSGYITSAIKDRYGIPVVLTENSSNFVRGRVVHPGQHWVVRRTLDKMDVTLAVGQELADVLSQYERGPSVQVLGNVVDTEFFQPASTFPPYEPLVFASVGNLIPLKGIDLLLQAFAQQFRGQGVQLKIGGSGSEEANLKVLTHRLDIESQVAFLGRLSREQVRDLYQTSHCIVSASHTETFGVTLIEAMACGKPVIATRSGGPNGFVTPAAGILIPTNDVPSLADALVQMKQSYSQYDATLIRQYCVERFSETSISEKLEAIYSSVVSV